MKIRQARAMGDGQRGLAKEVFSCSFFFFFFARKCFVWGRCWDGPKVLFHTHRVSSRATAFLTARTVLSICGDIKNYDRLCFRTVEGFIARVI